MTTPIGRPGAPTFQEESMEPQMPDCWADFLEDVHTGRPCDFFEHAVTASCVRPRTVGHKRQPNY